MRNRHRPREEINLTDAQLGAALNEYRSSFLNKKGIFYRGSRIASRAELSCIKALETYTDWQMVEGKTYQIPIGHKKTVDFKVGDTLVEFHPIILSREMSKGVYKAFEAFLKETKQHRRHELREIMRAHILEEYARKRHWTIRQNADEKIASAELLVVTDANSFLRAVIRPNATRRLPTNAEFSKRFKSGNFPS